MPSSLLSKLASAEPGKSVCSKCLTQHRAGRSCPACRRAKRDAFLAVGGLAAIFAFIFMLAVSQSPWGIKGFVGGIVLAPAPALLGLWFRTPQVQVAKRRLFGYGGLLCSLAWITLPLWLPWWNWRMLSSNIIVPAVSWGLGIALIAAIAITWRNQEEEEEDS